MEVGSQLADGSVSLIFTDPPYDRETVPLYGDLGALAARVLKPGGSLVTYCGDYAIPDVLDLILPHLSWWWILTLLHSGPHARMLQRGVIVEKKSLLWFVKGNSRAERSLVADVIHCDRDKRFHEWGQGAAPALHCIERLTAAGELVADPFAGGGTTIAAARQLARRGWACDVDPGAVAIARARLHDVA
jgi:site-specific DNA-methyltransferase (adenine-specific)